MKIRQLTLLTLLTLCLVLSGYKTTYAQSVDQKFHLTALIKQQMLKQHKLDVSPKVIKTIVIKNRTFTAFVLSIKTASILDRHSA